MTSQNVIDLDGQPATMIFTETREERNVYTGNIVPKKGKSKNPPEYCYICAMETCEEKFRKHVGQVHDGIRTGQITTMCDDCRL